ncbi:MAG TPA: hypothetical protein VFT16_01385 [Candidatus Saccharimonadales bacterium]|nr:hypothetical protein [Candidatus Saccharimonadales bacterium]
MTYQKPPKPLPTLLREWWPATLLASVLSFAIGGLCLLGGIVTTRTGAYQFGGFMLTVGACLAMVGITMYLIWTTQQPIAGVVLRRYIEIGGFMPQDLHPDLSFAAVLATSPTTPSFQCAFTRYWLYVVPFGAEGGHWFQVDRGTFEAHAYGSHYDLAAQ